MGLDEVIGTNGGSTDTRTSSSSWMTNSVDSNYGIGGNNMSLLNDSSFGISFKNKLRSRSEIKDVKKIKPLVGDHNFYFSKDSKLISKSFPLPVTVKIGERNFGSRSSRTPSPVGSVGSRYTQRRRSPSITRSRPGSPARSCSPAGSLDFQYEENIKKIINKVQKKKFYLLQQPGPRSFIVEEESTERKYKVMIGPQTCTCNHGPPCIHLLFIMMRVFGISENDSLLWSRKLQEFEVESLFAEFERLKQSLLAKKENYVSLSTSHSKIIEQQHSFETCNEGERCSICLLELHDGSELVQCETGCRNKFHRSCLNKWAKHCKEQGDSVICPLCRATWEKDWEVATPTNENEFVLINKSMRTNARRIRYEIKDLSKLTTIFGEVVGPDLGSKDDNDWKMKEETLKRLQEDIERSSSLLNKDRIIQCCTLISTYARHSVYRVYDASIQCFKTLCKNITISEFQDVLHCVLEVIIQKCGENPKKCQILSLNTVIDICHLDANFALKSIFNLTGNKEWKKTLGSLNVLEALLSNCWDKFQFHRLMQNTEDNFTIDRLKNIVRLLSSAIRISHPTVIATAKRVLKHFVNRCEKDLVLFQQLRTILLPDSLLNAQIGSFVLEETSSPVGCKARSTLLRRSSISHFPSCSGISPIKDSVHLSNDEQIYRVEGESKRHAWTNLTRPRGCSPKRARPNYLPLKKDVSFPSTQVKSLISPRFGKTEISSPRHMPVINSKRSVDQVKNSRRFQDLTVNVKTNVLNKPIIAFPPKIENDYCCLVEVNPIQLEGRFDKTEYKPANVHLSGENQNKQTNEKCWYIENVHWRKSCVLGNGAFSTCFQARDLKTGALMAVKQVSFCRNVLKDQDKVKKCIEDEVKMMSRLNHPNIVRCLGAIRHENYFNVFVEWMAGGSISNLLEKFGTFSEPVIINYSYQVLSGLSYLHSKCILHRDLKGANLLVDSSGRHLRIGDFGAAALLQYNSTLLGEFQGQLLGTIAFMAPEVLRGESYGRSCDLWSVGCCIIEMATSRPPWNLTDLSNHLALIYKIARTQGPPPIPDNLSPLMKDLVLKCLAISSEDRPTAEQLLQHFIFM